MPIVVTGCQGQLGSELCRQLGTEAVGLDLPEFDLCDAQGVRRALVTVRPRAVVNTAAYTLVDRAEQQPDLCHAINADAVGHLADLCRELDAVLVHISTDYVFGHGAQRQIPYLETDEPGPQGAYARSKLAGERLAAAWPRHFIVRSCGLYGRPGPRSAGNFVATMLRLARQGRPLRVVNDQCCSPTYVPHLARAIRFLLGTRAYGTYHVVNTGQTTWYGFAAEIFRQAGLSVRLEPITTAEYGAPAPRPAYSALDTAKYHALPGRPPMPPWQTALAEYLREAGRWADGTA
ncbi:MAG: dTDP-4-dehydrorhamnose reductase [Thermoguttaceae bacterium]|nr:dTDP-4-dehydrorhamnose reductase [Thermoguttaceae bacterium]